MRKKIEEILAQNGVWNDKVKSSADLILIALSTWLERKKEYPDIHNKHRQSRNDLLDELINEIRRANGQVR